MIPYPSIDSIWARDKVTNRLIDGKWRVPAHREIRTWLLTEKIDGMNIRVILGHDEARGNYLEVRGRTDRAQLPQDLVKNIEEMLWPRDLHRYFEISAETPRIVTLYGEGYGAGIQKVGRLYRQDKSFILFDVRRGDAERGFWMNWDELRRIANDLTIPLVPLVGVTSYDELQSGDFDLREHLPHSFIVIEPTVAEGVVARPVVELLDTFGNRVMWKLTYRDLPADGVDREGA